MLPQIGIAEEVGIFILFIFKGARLQLSPAAVIGIFVGEAGEVKQPSSPNLTETGLNQPAAVPGEE